MAGLTLTNVTANLKQKFAPKLLNVIPNTCILQQYRDPNAPGMEGRDAKGLGADVAVPIKWTEIKSLGRYWELPIKTQSGQGFTYTGEGATLSDLEDALDIKIVEAQVKGSSATMRQQVPYNVGSTADGASADKAFENIAKIVMDDMKSVAYTRYELSALWGMSGLGVVSSQTYSNPTLTVTVTAASFSPTIWISLIGARFQWYDASGNYSMNASTDYGTLIGVNTVTRVLTFTLDSNWGTNTTVPAANSNMFLKSSHVTGGTTTTYSKEMVGLWLQATAVSGTYFNIAREDNPLIQGQTIDAASQSLTGAFAVQCAMKLADKGLFDDVVFLVGTAGWADLNTENMTLRLFDSSYSPKKASNGSEYITYQALNAQIRVVCHPLMKAGFALMFNPAQCEWIGSTDLTFKTPSQPEQELFVQISGKDGYEVRAFCSKALFLTTPSQALGVSGIVNQS
jgi:hypothetical protein